MTEQNPVWSYGKCEVIEANEYWDYGRSVAFREITAPVANPRSCGYIF